MEFGKELHIYIHIYFSIILMLFLLEQKSVSWCNCVENDSEGLGVLVVGHVPWMVVVVRAPLTSYAVGC